MRMGRLFGLLLLAGPAFAAPAAPIPTWHRVAGNLLKNPSFEHNWFNRALAERRRFLLLQATDMGVGECDGHVDHWQVRGAPLPDAWDTETARSGGRSLRFAGSGTAAQLVRCACEQYWQAGGAHYSRVLPMDASLAGRLRRRPLVVGAWCRTFDVPAGSEPQLTLRVECATRPSYDALDPARTMRAAKSVSFSAGTHNWEYRELRLEPDALEGTPFLATVELAARGKSGVVWFDDASLVEPTSPGEMDRAPNGGFEALGPDGWPEGWSRPALWDWFRNDYYTWTGWSHSESKEFRGGAAADRMLTWSGTASLRLTAYPGDNFAIESVPIALNQPEPRPIEVRAMVKADNVRTLEIMAKDEAGQWLPQGDFLGDDMEEPGAYNFGSTGCGTYDWCCVRKYFSPRKPLKSLRLVLAVRGFDGKLVEKNLVGTLWIDDVQVFEHDGPGSLPAPGTPPSVALARGLRVVDLDLGDRLWGKNTARVFLEFDAASAGAARACRLDLSLRTPAGKVRKSAGRAQVLRPAAAGSLGLAVVSAPYVVDELCRSWQEQYALTLSLPGTGALPPAVYPFGTPSKLVTAGVSEQYAYPEEKVAAYAQINASAAALAELGPCEFALSAGGGKERVQKVADLQAIRRPQRAPEYIDTRNLAMVMLQAGDFTVHPWQEPVRDNRVVVRLYRAGKPLAESRPMQFGFLERLPPPDFPERIERTAVNERGYLTVNGRPYFPVYWTPHFGILPEADYPPQSHKLKGVDLTEIVYSKNAMPDDEVKAKLLAKIAQVKDDPKLFQYELGEGEMQLQDEGWKQRLEWCRRVLPWIREADPNHIINGPISWLVGHPRHNETMPSFVPAWDAIGVEASFESVPEISRAAGPLMKERHTAVLVGLETYFCQSGQVLRWRGYRAVLNGAAGIGLCPSGMMECRPDKVNALRGLNAEFRRLGPVITDAPPADRIAVEGAGIDTMERLHDGKRYLIAVRGAEDGGPVKARFRLPAGARCSAVNVLFEGRALRPDAGGFEDEFTAPRDVHVYELAP